MITVVEVVEITEYRCWLEKTPDTRGRVYSCSVE
jgi:hypothetical protein